MTDAYASDLARWRAERLAALMADDGWMNLTDRVELDRPCDASVGRDADNDLVITAGPAHLGRLVLDAEDAILRTPGADLPFQPVPDAFPRLIHEGLMLEIHTVEGQPALRVRDLSSAARAAFPGLHHFPTDPAWVIRAEWVALDEPETLTIGMVNGAADQVRLTHVARFSHNGQPIQLLPTHVKGGKPMFVFRDQTSRDMTYGASRFLFGSDIAGGHITLDFNRAINPPCAFTDLAVCPLPPPGNILPFRIEAGELRP